MYLSGKAVKYNGARKSQYATANAMQNHQKQLPYASIVTAMPSKHRFPRKTLKTTSHLSDPS